MKEIEHTNAKTNADKAKVWKEITKFVNQCKGGWTKKIGRPNQGKVEESEE
jgi:hypothetical protein